MKYAKLNYEKTAVIEYLEFDNLPPHKIGYILPFIESSPPVFDSTAQYIVEGVPTIDSDKVTQIWEIKDKSPEEIVLAKRKTWTSFEFLHRLTPNETDALFSSAETDLIAKKFLFMLGIATQIENDHPETIQGLQYFISIGVITETRMNEILDL